ncbi:MAG TPA: hypothetical protein VNH39_09170 [Steroidobacteraceae bacterium]|nr:hypothetical protein [Steroidobacteraceae bacterium]
MYTRPNAPGSIGGVLDDGLKLWLESLSKTWPLALLAQLLYAIPLIMLRVQLKDMPVALGSNALTAANAANAQLFLALMKSPVLILTYLVTILIAVVCYTAIVTRIEGVSANGAPSLQASLASGFRLLPRVLLQLLVFFVSAIVFTVALGIIAGIVGGIAGGIAGGTKSAVMPIISFTLVLLFAFFLLGRIFLSFFALAVDDAGAIESIKVSWTLTRGSWWRCSAILVVLVIIGIVFALVIAFANGLVVISLGAASVAATVLTQLVGVVSNAFLGSLYPAVLIAIFHDLKLRKQGGDLAGRVNALAPQ